MRQGEFLTGADFAPVCFGILCYTENRKRREREMKKTIGWILVIVGGFFCFDCVVCTSVAFTVDDATLAERIAVLVSCIAMAAVNG